MTIANSHAELSGSVAIVTGASSGLGWHFAQVLAMAGAKVALAGRRAPRLTELADIINSEGGSALACPTDLCSPSSIKTLVDSAETAFGTVDILINNAGIPDAQRATRMSAELVDRVLNTNLRAPFLLSTDVARRLIEKKSAGRIINIASMAAFHYDGNGAALYSTTKAAIVRMTEALAVEWARYGINVNAIAPGFFHSEMTDAMLDRVGDVSATFPRRRVGNAPQLDSTLMYLCDPNSECVTGSVIKADDGQFPR